MPRTTVKLLAGILSLQLSLGATPALAALSFDIRTIDGSANNVANSTWGSTETQLLRLTSVDYFDDITEPRGGSGAVSARAISNAIAAQSSDIKNARGLSDMFWTWGQFVDHDIDLTNNASPAEPYPIAVPTGDPYFDPLSTGTKTIGFNRSISDPSTGTSVTNPRQQINEITSFLDTSNVYGPNSTRSTALRTLSGGLLKTSNGNLLPFNTAGLPNAMSTSAVFFLAGDVRANEQPGLTALHTLFVREHNRIAEEIAREDPLLSDEDIYQTARRTVGAIAQSITYNDFLPALFGSDAIPSYSGYNSSVNAGIANEFSTAAYRLGHSMISSVLLRLDQSGLEIPQGHVSLIGGFFNPAIIQEADIDPIFRGLSAQVMQEVDTQEIDALRNFLFGPPGAGGFDLVSLNIQRGRDHGLAGFNQARRDLGLTAYTSFSEITSHTSVASALETVYQGDIEAIDLWVGGLAENHLTGSSLGQTFTKILTDQFTRLRDGDRFWYESQFTGTQLEEIRSTTLKDVIERNTSVTGLQDNVFFAEYPQADLETETSLPSLTLSGSLITSEIHVLNNGPLSASGVTVTIPVPANTTFTTDGSSLGCVLSGVDVICETLPLDDEEGTDVTVVFTPTLDACFSTITVSGTASALQQDTTNGNNTSSDDTFYACPGPNDLDLSASVGSSISAQRGGSFSALATMTNNGPAFASGALLSMSIPSGLEVNLISVPTCTASSNTITCADIEINQSNSFSVEIELTIPESFSCPVDAAISASTSGGQQLDYFEGNNTSTATTSIECEPENDLSVSLSGPSESPAGQPVEYIARTENLGPATALSPVINVSLPAGVTFTAATSSSECVQNGSNIECSIAALGDGDSRDATIVFTPLPTLPCNTELSTEASVSSKERETHPSNNTSATIQTTLTCTVVSVDTTENGGSSVVQFNPLDRDTVGRSNSTGATRGKGTSEAKLALALLCRMNGMGNTIAYTGHFRLSNNAIAMTSLATIGSDRSVITDGWTEEERRVVCGMKKYMETQDPRNRKTDEFKQWLIGEIAKDLHRTHAEVEASIADEYFCR